MRGLVIAVFAAVVASSGCVQPQPPAETELTPAAAAPSDESSQAPPETPPTTSRPEDVAEAPRPAATSRPVPDTAVAAPDRQAPPAPPEQMPPAEPVAQASTPPDEAPLPPPDEAPLPPPVAPPALALDLAGLEQRLRDTRAIGVFTKLSLKNQVDDLLAQFRAFYRGQLEVQLADLRQRYELLLFKVLTLLQDSDRDLAEAIAASREAIWEILSDPQKLAQI